MATNRQRASVLSSNLLDHQAKVAEVAISKKRKEKIVGDDEGQESANKKQKVRQCGNAGCLRSMQEIDTTGHVAQAPSSNSTGKLVGSSVWSKCGTKYCRFIFCPNEACQRCCTDHRKTHK